MKHEKISKKESTSFEWESYCWWVAKLYYTFAVVWSSDSHSHVVWWKGVLWHSSLPHYVNSLRIFFINNFLLAKKLNRMEWLKSSKIEKSKIEKSKKNSSNIHLSTRPLSLQGMIMPRLNDHGILQNKCHHSWHPSIGKNGEIERMRNMKQRRGCTNSRWRGEWGILGLYVGWMACAW